MKLSNDLPILICSYDKCYQRWPIVNFFLTKYWADCPLPIYLGANGSDKRAECPPQWIYLNTGPDHSWAASMLDYLAQIPNEYVLVWVDDTALLATPKLAEIDEVFSLMQANNAVMCRLNPRPGPTLAVNKIVGRIDVAAGVPYITSRTNVIWKKAFLIELLRYNFNAWTFEVKAGKVSEALAHSKDFYACKRPIINYMHFVEKNYFDPKIITLLKQAGSDLDVSQLPFLTKSQVWRLRWRHYFAKLQDIVPAKYQNKLRKLLSLQQL